MRAPPRRSSASERPRISIVRDQQRRASTLQQMRDLGDPGARADADRDHACTLDPDQRGVHRGAVGQQHRDARGGRAGLLRRSARRCASPRGHIRPSEARPSEVIQPHARGDVAASSATRSDSVLSPHQPGGAIARGDLGIGTRLRATSSGFTADLLAGGRIEVRVGAERRRQDMPGDARGGRQACPTPDRAQGCA